MFFVTAGRGTECFLAEEMQEFSQDMISVRDGKVFLNPSSSKNVTQCLQAMMSLKSAERIFATIADYDNSEFIDAKRTFLDKIMSVLSEKDSYSKANSVLEAMRNSYNTYCCPKNEFQKSQSSFENEILKSDEDKTVLPKKRPRLELDNSPTENLKSLGQRALDDCKKATECGKTITFRMSIKCSGKLRKKLDLKRLSRDIAWRVQQASGWKAQLRQPDMEVCVHISNEYVTVGVPLTRQPLSKRSYLQDPGLRAPVAWIMCSLADIRPGDIVLDPMCGKATVLLEGASNMPYRDCCADAVVCDAPFNQKHLLSLTPEMFYGKFLREIHRVLRTDGKCILLVSQELLSVILSLVQSSKYVESNRTGTEDSSCEQSQDSDKHACSDTIPSSSQGNLPEPSGHTTLHCHPHASSMDSFSSCITKTKSAKSGITSSEVMELNFIEEKWSREMRMSFDRVAQYDVKLGETLACILKFIKR
ncbi:THUMP domain-containing protein 2-like [Elysia marginata]|uniref:THUMP domain-containing protein 2-like n=1 Tax=Elysia marginata TaxID=1093978 RepID=A0AAV4JNU6_9GAST|nr:THUMP domain-containing protein 2-like [Elysia marginata]